MLVLETYYHIYNHANGDENLFRKRKNYGFFLKKYHQHIAPIAETIAWCLMPNHFHLLIRTKSEAEIEENFSKVRNFGKVDNEAKSRFLSKQFANFFSRYTQAFNKVYGRRGSLFLKNFKRKEIHDEIYLRNLVFYIHLNPVKHGFTEKVSDWEHSSYTTFPIKKSDLLTRLFENDENYRFLHRTKHSSFNEYERLENDLTQ